MTWEDVVRPDPAPRPKPVEIELCGDITGYGYEDTVSCEKRDGHDDPMAEMASRRYDPIHQATLGGDPHVVVTWVYR